MINNTKSRAIDFTFKMCTKLLIYIFVMPLINVFLITTNTVQFTTIIVYGLFLLWVGHQAIQFNKKNPESISEFEEEICAWFNLILLFHIVYFITYWYYNREPNSIFMALVCGSLYLGFTISLNDLLNAILI